MPSLPFVTEDDDVPPFIMQTELITEADWASLSLLESWTEEKVAQIGAKRTQDLIRAFASQGRFDAKMRDALLQLVSIISSEEERAQAQALPAVPAAPSRAKTGNNNSLSQSLILKLIAGVQNAGTDVSRRKNHG